MKFIFVLIILFVFVVLFFGVVRVVIIGIDSV